MIITGKCPYCPAPHIPGDGHYAECIVILRIFGPPRRMCRRCANDAAPRRLLCAECQVKYGRTAYERLKERKAHGVSPRDGRMKGGVCCG